MWALCAYNACPVIWDADIRELFFDLNFLSNVNRQLEFWAHSSLGAKILSGRSLGTVSHRRNWRLVRICDKRQYLFSEEGNPDFKGQGCLKTRKYWCDLRRRKCIRTVITRIHYTWYITITAVEGVREPAAGHQNSNEDYRFIDYYIKD